MALKETENTCLDILKLGLLANIPKVSIIQTYRP